MFGVGIWSIAPISGRDCCVNSISADDISQTFLPNDDVINVAICSISGQVIPSIVTGAECKLNGGSVNWNNPYRYS